MSSSFHRLVKWWPVATATGIATVLTGWAAADHAARRTAPPVAPAVAHAEPLPPPALDTNATFRLAAAMWTAPRVIAAVEVAAMPREFAEREVADMPRAFVEVAAMPRTVNELAAMPRAFVEVADMPRAFVEVAVMPRTVNELAAMPRAFVEVAAMPREVAAEPTGLARFTQRAAEAVGVFASLVLFAPEGEQAATPVKLGELTTATLSALVLDYLNEPKRTKGIHDKFVTDAGLDFSEKGFALDAAKGTLTFFKVKEPSDKAAFKASLTKMMLDVMQKPMVAGVEAWVAKLELVFDQGTTPPPPPPPVEGVPCPPVLDCAPLSVPCPPVVGCAPVPSCAPAPAACASLVVGPVCSPAPARCGPIRRLIGLCR